MLTSFPSQWGALPVSGAALESVKQGYVCKYRAHSTAIEPSVDRAVVGSGIENRTAGVLQVCVRVSDWG